MSYADDYLDHLDACVDSIANEIEQLRAGRVSHQDLWDALSQQVSIMAQIITRADREMSGLEDAEEDDDDEFIEAPTL